jgi:uncharacterized Zn-finger protein
MHKRGTSDLDALEQICIRFDVDKDNSNEINGYENLCNILLAKVAEIRMKQLRRTRTTEAKHERQEPLTLMTMQLNHVDPLADNKVEIIQIDDYEQKHKMPSATECNRSEPDEQNEIFDATHMFDLTTQRQQQHFACPVNGCRKMLANEMSVDRHVQRVHENRHDKNRCDYCDRRFANSGHLLRHRRIHTNERPYKCDVCQLAFTRSDKLSEHRRRKHVN